MQQRQTLRLIALFEAFKGVIVLLVAAGALSLLHKDLRSIAISLVEHAHLNPASHYPQIFIDAASHTQNARLLWLAVGAAVYSLIRLAEAWGLYFERAWAEVLAAGSGAIYVPFEVLELVRRPTLLGAALLLINLGIVAVMLRALQLRRGRVNS